MYWCSDVLIAMVKHLAEHTVRGRFTQWNPWWKATVIIGDFYLSIFCGFCSSFSLGACGKPITEFGQHFTIGDAQKIFLMNKICLHLVV